MIRPSRAAAAPGGLALLGCALAFAQRPGLATSDTKINLYVQPVRFLAEVGSMWTSSGQLGDVQAGQYAGYLFPMSPLFAAGHMLGIAPWVVQRLWLGTLLALSAWGATRMIECFAGRRGGAGPVVGGLVMIFNPFVVTYIDRTTITLLAYAALPWLLVCVHRGLAAGVGASRWERWRWPAAIALLVAASGGGVNAAVTAWMLVGPMLLGLYEWRVLRADGRHATAFLGRAALLVVLASAWWLVPAQIQASYGINFLPFTEQPGTVWGTTSATEALRLMSFWLSYVGIGFQGRPIPYFADAQTLLFSTPVVLASLLLPALALAGFLGACRTRHGPFLLALALLAVVIITAGFPDGTPLRHGLYFAYNHLPPIRFLRASYKAAPLLAVALAGLAGLGSDAAWRSLAGRRAAVALRAGGALAVALVLIGAAWPLVSGRAQDPQVSFRRIPAAWRAAARDLDASLPGNSRAMVLPGELFSFYTWGGTTDPILPALARSPIAERTEVPYSDLRATDLLWTIDGLVHQRRLLPGQLGPLLSLAGVRSVVTATDADLARSDAPAPADVAATLATQSQFVRPAARYGPVRPFAPSTGAGPRAILPEVRRYDLPAARGIVRVEGRADPVVVDGSAQALASLAGFGWLPRSRAVLYSADLAPARLRALLAAGGDLVVSDANRRQAFVASRLEDNLGAVLTPSQNISADGFIFDPFGGGSGRQTVAVYGGGVASVSAPFSPQVPQYPQHAPFAAVDGSSATDWEADPSLGQSGATLTVTFTRPRDIPYVDLEPSTTAGTVRRVTVAGHGFAVHAGFNRLRLGLRSAQTLTVALTRVTGVGQRIDTGGISELRIPDLHPTEALRLPADATNATTASGLRYVRLIYLFERVTGDDPFHRDPAAQTPPGLQADGDAETVMHRVFAIPAQRHFTAEAWVTPAAGTSDAALDRLLGYRGPVRATSSSRVEGMPRYRASAALDGDPSTAWIADATQGEIPRWRIALTRGSMAMRVLRILPPPVLVNRVAKVRLSWPGGESPTLAVPSSGRVVLPHTVRTRSLTLDVLASTPQPGATAAQRRAVGIGELEGIRGVGLIHPARRPELDIPCGAVRVTVGGVTVPLKVRATVAGFGSSIPLPARSCGKAVALTRGTAALAVAPGAFAVDDLALVSPAPAPAAAVRQPAAILSAGHALNGDVSGIRLEVRKPSWLVLGEGYNRGWEASCNGRSLGAPIPIDAASNGWPVAPGCLRATLRFGPDRLARAGYLVSGLAMIACLVIILGAAVAVQRRSRVAGSPLAPADERPRDSAVAIVRDGSLRACAAAAVLAGLGFGFVFGLGAGMCAVPIAMMIVLSRAGERALTVAACLLLGVVVPVLYLLAPTDPAAGNHDAYALRHLPAHWVAVAALGLLLAALLRALSALAVGRRPG